MTTVSYVSVLKQNVSSFGYMVTHKLTATVSDLCLGSELTIPRIFKWMMTN